MASFIKANRSYFEYEISNISQLIHAIYGPPFAHEFRSKQLWHLVIKPLKDYCVIYLEQVSTLNAKQCDEFMARLSMCNHKIHVRRSDGTEILPINNLSNKKDTYKVFRRSCLKDSPIIIGIEMLKPEFSQNPSTAFSSTTPPTFNNIAKEISPSKVKTIWTEELHNPATADVRFMIDDHELFASSSILAKRSKCFKEIFDEMKRDTKSEINEKLGIREKGKSDIGESDEKLLTIPDEEESWSSFDDTLSIASTTSSTETVFTPPSKPPFKSHEFDYELVISDFPYNSVLQMLQFLYTDDLPFTDKVSSNSYSISDEIYSLYGIADKYQIHDLKIHLKKLILCNIRLETCAEMLFKHVWKWPELKRVVMPFVVKYFAKIKCTQGYLNILEKCKCGDKGIKSWKFNALSV
ncbi:28262_t:CDS:2 [Dentiscutata erythropus]|uniref:28262_t:CDS:1 n=1 Tax=Dentiscutata erythropus TaxID=1348616 RepID=A0A9N8VFJ8_9GLOM|nr:28262_t:CDS:2 [Dentiscutata erythropus]